MSLSAADLEFLAGERGREILARPLPDDPLAARRLLGDCTAAEARAVTVLAELRRRSADKLPPEWAARCLSTDKLLQQASSLRLAVYKGRRLIDWAGPGGFSAGVWDLCCGMGIDAMGLAMAGGTVSAVDVDPAAVHCARHNLGLVGGVVTVEQADVTALELPAGAIVHVDPDRRATGRRSRRLADLQPSWDWLSALPGRGRGGVIKLSPATDPAELAGASWSRLEYVEEGRTCRQLLLWWGPEAGEGRQATVLAGEMRDPVAVSLPAGRAGPAALAAPGAFVVEPGPAVLAAGAVDDLADQLGLWRWDRSLPWLFGPRPLATPLGRCVRVLDRAAGREKDVARVLRSHRAGAVEVKPRNVRLDTDRLQRKLAGRGSRRLAVLWGRVGSSQQALIVEPLAEGDGAW